ncbi:O-antigen ligase family protein [Gordonia sp. NPDC003424]
MDSLVAVARMERARDDGIPWLGAVFCVMIPLMPAIAVAPGPLKGQGSPARLLGFLAFVVVALGFIHKRHNYTRLNPGTVILLIVLMLQLLTFFTGAFAPGGEYVEDNKLRVAFVTVAYAGMGLYITTRVRFRRQQQLLIGALLIGLAWAMVVGILQSVGGIDLRSTFVPPGFIDILPVEGLSERGDSVRVVGTSEHAIEFAVLAAITVPLALHMTRYASTRARRRASAVAAVLACLAIPLSVSRTGALVLFAVLAVYSLALSLRFLATAAVAGLGLLLAYKIVYPGPLNSLLASILGASTDSSITTRTDDYAAVSEMFHQHPWLGIGLGGNPPPEFRWLDNQWLQAIVQGGVVGIVALIALLSAGVAGLFVGVSQAENRRARDQTYALGAAFVGVSVSTFTFDLFSFQQAAMMLFVLFGLLWSGPKVCGPPRAAPGTAESTHSLRLESSRSQVAADRGAP